MTPLHIQSYNPHHFTFNQTIRIIPHSIIQSSEVLHHPILIDSKPKDNNGYLSHSLSDERMVLYVQLMREQKSMWRML